MALFGQVEDARPPSAPLTHSTVAADAGDATTTEITAESLEVHDRPDEASYITAVLNRGARVKIRDTVHGGWLAIEPPDSSICWIEKSAIQANQDSVGGNGHVAEPTDTQRGRPSRATIAKNDAIMRSGNLSARLPGPPLGHLSQGTMVRILDRRPLTIGSQRLPTVWYAILPPPDVVFYVRSDGTRPSEAPQKKSAERQAVYTAARFATSVDENPPLEGVSAAVAAEIKTVDATHQSIRTNQSIAQWRLDTVRSSYQAILKRAGNDPHVEEAVRLRLARVTRDEQAALAAKTIEDILGQSHRRDQEVATQKRRVAAAGRSRARTFSAVGYMQASIEKIEGRKLYVLIGKDGSTLAYLDIPPGLDVDRMVAHRVGVRGDPHYNEDLGSRVITVRDLETTESRR
jgi:hypothetical protein